MISVILPAYNECKNLESLIPEIEDVFSKNNINGEIIVVDDGSTDNSEKLLNFLKKEYDNLTTIKHDKNLGQSTATNSGLKKCRGDKIIIIDSDMQFYPKDIPLFLKKLEEFDIIVGYDKNKHSDFLLKNLAAIFNKACRLIYGININDFKSGFKGFRKTVIKDLQLKKGEHRFIIPLVKKNHSIYEVKIETRKRRHGRSKYSITKKILGSLCVFIKICKKRIMNTKIL